MKLLKQRNITSTTRENCHIHAFAPSTTKESIPYWEVNGIDKQHTKTYPPRITEKYADMIKASVTEGPYAAT